MSTENSRAGARFALAVAVLPLGKGSTLEPAGLAADRVATLFWALTIGAAVIWLVVVGLALYAVSASRRPQSPRGSTLLIVGGGVIFPTVVLVGLLIWSLSMLPGLLAPAPAGSLEVRITGYQWWWRVEYLGAEGATIELANELHLPVGEPVELQLESHDVIHSFWVPALGGKMDMIPGRRTRLRLEPTKVGVYRGVCAEYCGTSHALMSLVVVVEEREAWERWLAAQAKPATSQGEALFLAQGCGACHTIRGTAADGALGPDLTHVGSRASVGAGVIEADVPGLEQWLAKTSHLKPGVLMPSFGMLPPPELTALAQYLAGLR